MDQLALQYHLYRYPLYKHVDNETELRVAILGFGETAKKFLDLTLQNSQLLREVPVVHVFSGSAERDAYLFARPELKNFFTIDKISSPNDTYGYIFFDIGEPTEDDALKKIVALKPHYVFIALNESNLNVALACKKNFDSASIKACVSFPASDDTCPQGLYPVSYKVTDSKLLTEIERQAFNAHLLWQKNLNVDFDSIREEYSVPYNHGESIASVLGLKYKFHAWGIELEDPAEAARKFISLKSHGSMDADFLYTEHRRWLTSMICRSFVKREIADCADGTTKNPVKKNHVCLVRCRADRLLRDTFSREDWNSRSIDELDELDQVSVKLHRLYTEQVAEKVLNKREFIYKRLEEIRAMLGGKNINERNFGILIPFNDLKISFETMLTGDAKQISRYKGLSQTLRTRIEDLPSAIEKLDAFEKTYVKPLQLSLEYRDYKDYESAMFEYISFVMTYTTKVRLVIPFADDGNLTKFFGNVAAATVINPEKIIYMAFSKTLRDFDRLKILLSHVLSYIDRKHLRAAIEVVVFHCDNIDCEHNDRMIFHFRKVRCVNPAPEIVDATKKFLQDLQQEVPDTFTALELNDTALSNMLAGASLYESYRSYSFDSLRKKFFSSNDCEMFSYINTSNIFISPSDIATLSGYLSIIRTQTLFDDDDISRLWDRYSSNTTCWKNLCTRLRQSNRTGLKISNLNISNYKAELQDTFLELLRFFADHNYILDLNTEDPSSISFRYSNMNVNDLLKTEGRMFEIFVFHKLRKLDYFDDVILSFEPHMQTDFNVQNELDMIMTIANGFRTVVLECKSTGISPADYSRLRILADRFGVNPLVVMVVETRVQPIQESFGKDLGVVTISGENVTHIGKIICEQVQ